MNAGTCIAADGLVKYTAYGSTFLYHGESEPAARQSFMGGLYSEEGHYEAAIREYQAALRKQPDALGIHYRLGVAAPHAGST